VTDKQILIEIGKNLANARRKKGITQVELANRIGIEKSNYNIIEKGKSNPQILTYAKICTALECELHELFELKTGLLNLNDSPKKYIPRKHKK